jgi:5'-deoxynucleotidase YfbR-like HD superfamily hydrolase
MTDEPPDPEALADAVSDLAGLALDFAATDRTCVYLKDRETPESDADHTVMLAWVAGALAALLYADDLDPFLVTTHAVWHDAVEVFAGDTPTLRIDEAGRAAKAEREASAVREWQDRFARSLPWAGGRPGAYEAQGGREARFVKAVDKMMPRLVHMFDRCAGLHEVGLTAAELASGLPEVTARITGHGEFPELEAIAVVFAGRLANIHAATAPMREQGEAF